MKRRLFLLALGFSLTASGCVFVQSGAILDESEHQSPANVVETTEHGSLGVLHLTAPSHLTERANQSLLSQCPSKRMENLKDQLTVRDYFLIVQLYTLRAQADCLPVIQSVTHPSVPVEALSGARQTNRGMIFTLGSLLFKTNEATILPEARESLTKLASYLKAAPKRRIMIEGYTDNRGSLSLNRNLSERRAKNVEEALEKEGIDPDRIAEVRGFGPRYPVSSNHTAEGRQKNRRVEIVISEEDGHFKDHR